MSALQVSSPVLSHAQTQPASGRHRSHLPAEQPLLSSDLSTTDLPRKWPSSMPICVTAAGVGFAACRRLRPRASVAWRTVSRSLASESVQDQGFDSSSRPSRSPRVRGHAAAFQLLCNQLDAQPEQGTAVLCRPEPSASQYHVPSEALASANVKDDSGYRTEYMYRPDGSAAPDAPVVDCSGWDSSSRAEQRRMIEASLRELRTSGYVVLERLLPAERLLEIGREFRRYKESNPEGVTFARMRAQRTMTIPPFEGVWTEDWLVRHPLVMALLARHLRNSIDTSDEKAAEMQFAHWMANGGHMSDMLEGSLSGGFPVLDLLVVVDTPPGAPSQTRHRDTILPGPCASLGVHIPLTHLQLDPLNGAIGFSPCSQSQFSPDAAKRDVVGAAPLGSIILYDSFTEHHGLPNDSSDPRAALFAWFRVPGTYTGHTDENFGRPGLEITTKFRKHLQQKLRETAAIERQHCPGLAGAAADEAVGFSMNSELIDWGEEKVCFRCNSTTGNGSYSNKMWFCATCCSMAAAHGADAPDPHPDNVAPPFDDQKRFPEETLVQYAREGMNIRPSRGRHKLTLLRERGFFLPIDPKPSWLARVSTEPQPDGWKNALLKATGKIPRMDGF
eukprot:TRINITY_DN122165_c0_g1_i1.p1 TRINITY_DN122165_c0_g1~~TRINITY_DN122165_c0_g1_i1.p1  ORF type:complete len:616 (+),score=95.35 TRINITY_DN122165_c0_g1_i1:86-1933(+)